MTDNKNGDEKLYMVNVYNSLGMTYLTARNTSEGATEFLPVAFRSKKEAEAKAKELEGSGRILEVVEILIK